MRIPDDTHFELRNRMYAMRATSNYLCEKLGRSVCYFSARLNGKKPWDLEDVYNLCDILRIPYDEIPKFFPRDGIGIYGILQGKKQFHDISKVWEYEVCISEP